MQLDIMVENNGGYDYVMAFINGLGRYRYNVTICNDVGNGTTRFTVITIVTAVT